MSRHTPTSPERAPGRDTVLVADPDSVLRSSICDLLERSGYRVLARAETAAEAWPLARKLRPDAAVLGHPAGGRDLLDVSHALRSGTESGIILLTAIPNLEWIRAASSAGADILLARPPREADLVAGVELSLARRREARRLHAELAALRERAEAGAMVQRAKDVLMRRDGISDAEAYALLRRQAERSDRPLRSIAEAVLLSADVTSAA